MKNVFLILLFALWLGSPSYAQNEQAGAGSGSGSGSGRASTQTKATTTTTTKTEEPPNSRYPWVRTLTNVQIELTLTDQTGSAAPEKKTVSMIVASGNWGKVRSATNFFPTGAGTPFVVDFNVDARPLVSVDGPVQLELTLVYSPPGGGSERDNSKPTGINQSQTVILQSGKPMIISQAADPVKDRKVVVEIKATVLK